MTSSTDPIRHDSGHIVSAVLVPFVRLGAFTNGIVRTLQMGRMLSTLSSMNDEQLKQIGISRSEILPYAEKLMAKDT
ncbi:MAG: DUF1127 domain-containing protein [Roseobacter sp.]